MNRSELDEALKSRDMMKAAEAAKDIIMFAPDDWYAYFQLGNVCIAQGKSREAFANWINAFDRMGIEDFDGAFHRVADECEEYIVSTLWRSLDELDIENIDDLAYSIFTNFPEKRCEDTDLLIVLLKRMNAHLDDVNHVRYLVDLLDAAEMLCRKYFDMNVEIRTHMYASDIMLGLCSMAIIKSVSMLEQCNDKSETLRTVRIVGEIAAVFTKLRDTIYDKVSKRSQEEVTQIVSGWARRCTAPYMVHLDRAFELSIEVCTTEEGSPERLQEERDREIERYAEAYFS